MDQIHVSHLFLRWVNGLHFSTFKFKKPNDRDLYDQDPVCASINVWGSSGDNSVGFCKGCSNKQIKLFQSNMRSLHQNDPSDLGYGTPERFRWICKHMLQSLELVNKDKLVRSLKQESLK